MRSFVRTPAFVLLLALAGCDTLGTDEGANDLPDGRPDVAALWDEDGWTLLAASLDGRAYDVAGSPHGPFTARFYVDGTIGGRVSVNGYGGRYTARDNGAFSTDEIVMTLIGDSEEALRLVDVMMHNLDAAERFETNGCVLHVYSPRGVLRFGATCYESY